MKKLLLLSGLLVSGMLTTDGFAHGGQYRGPPDVVPPGVPGGSGPSSGPGGGPTTPGSGGPTTPGAGGPSSPGGAGPTSPGGSRGGGGGGPTSPGGMAIGEDLTRWQIWWEFNKDPFLQLRQAIHAQGVTTGDDLYYMGAGREREARDTMRPSESQLDALVPKLKQALDSTSQRDINSSCMVALAKIGRDHETFRILDVFRERLTSKDLEVRQTAAVAMGISQMTEGVDDLLAIAMDTDRGRTLTARANVDDYTRSFAAYGLGLVGYSTSDVDVKRKIFAGIRGILTDEEISDRNIRVAAIHAIGLLEPGVDPKGSALLKDATEELQAYWSKPMGVGEQLIQAHVPTAIAKLVRDSGDDTMRRRFIDEYLATLAGKTSRKRMRDQIVQSAAIALGRLGKPSDADVTDALVDYYKKGRDQQAQNFCLMALGQIGGERARTELMKVLQKGNKAMQKPWAALSLGVLCFHANAAGRDVDVSVGFAMQDWLGKIKNPETLGALAISLGLAKFADAGDELRALLAKHQSQDRLAGWISIGLALMDDQVAVAPIRELVETSVRRPERLRMTSIALGKLGDRRAATLLQKMLQSDSRNLATMSSIAGGLGLIGDRRSIEPLTRMLFDEGLTDLSRAFAAVALGGVADKEMLPWNSKIGTDMNYRAAVETLTNQQSGILDIL